MKNSVLAWLTMFGLLIAGFAHMAWFYPQLPAEVASHFDGEGNPNGWESKETFVLVYAGILLLVAVLFLAIGFLMRCLPAALFNIPNREYWLAPVRRKDSVRRISQSCLWFANAVIAFLIVTFHLTIVANLNPPPVLGGGFWIAFFVFMAFIGVWLVAFFRCFRLPEDDVASDISR